MGTAVATKNKTEVSTANAYISALIGLRNDVGAGGYDGKPLLKLKDGEWVFGEDNDLLASEDLVALNPTSFRVGWISFDEENKLVKTEDGDDADFLWPLDDPEIPSEDEVYDMYPLPEVQGRRARQHEYRYQIAVDVAIVAGPNAGTELTYKITSNGGKVMLSKLSGEIGRKMSAGAEECMPVVSLYSESYHSTKWKRDIDKPLAKIIGWMNPADTEFVEDEEKEVAHPKNGERTKAGHKVDQRAPARSAKRRKPEPEPEPEEEYEVETEEDVEEEAEEPRAKRGRPARDTSGNGTRSRRRAVAQDEPEADEGDDSEGEEEEQSTRRRASSDKPRGNAGRRRARPEPEPEAEASETDEDAQESTRGRRARAGGRQGSARRRRG